MEENTVNSKMIPKEDRVSYFNDLVQEILADPEWKADDFAKFVLASGIGWTILAN